MQERVETRKQSIARAESRRSVNDTLQRARLENQLAALRAQVEELEKEGENDQHELESLRAEKQVWQKERKELLQLREDKVVLKRQVKHIEAVFEKRVRDLHNHLQKVRRQAKAKSINDASSFNKFLEETERAAEEDLQKKRAQNKASAPENDNGDDDEEDIISALTRKTERELQTLLQEEGLDYDANTPKPEMVLALKAFYDSIYCQEEFTGEVEFGEGTSKSVNSSPANSSKSSSDTNSPRACSSRGDGGTSTDATSFVNPLRSSSSPSPDKGIMHNPMARAASPGSPRPPQPPKMSRKASMQLLGGQAQSVEMLLRTKPVGRIKKILKTKGIAHDHLTTKTELIHLLKKSVTEADLLLLQS